MTSTTTKVLATLGLAAASAVVALGFSSVSYMADPPSTAQKKPHHSVEASESFATPACIGDGLATPFDYDRRGNSQALKACKLLTEATPI